MTAHLSARTMNAHCFLLGLTAFLSQHARFFR